MGEVLLLLALRHRSCRDGGDADDVLFSGGGGVRYSGEAVCGCSVHIGSYCAHQLILSENMSGCGGGTAVRMCEVRVCSW